MSATTWYIARSAGIVAYLLLSAGVVLGVLMSARTRFPWPRFAIQEVHRFITIVMAVFLALHGLTLVFDRVVPLSLVQAIVPFTSPYRPFAVGLGVAAAELAAAVAVANALRGRLPYRLWRRIHYLTIGVWLAATAHALLAGTDRRDSWFIALLAIAVSAVALAFLVRFARAAGPAAIALVGAAAAASVLALAFAPQPPAPARTSSVVSAAGGGVPSSFSSALVGTVVSRDPVVSVLGRAGGAALRVDLLVDRGQVAQSALQIDFPSGASCSGTVDRLGAAGLSGSCGRSSVRIDWQIDESRHVTGHVAVQRGGA